MVKQKNNFFECEICKLLYAKKEHALKCEKWCSKHNSCNLEITKNAVQKNFD